MHFQLCYFMFVNLSLSSFFNALSHSTNTQISYPSLLALARTLDRNRNHLLAFLRALCCREHLLAQILSISSKSSTTPRSKPSPPAHRSTNTPNAHAQTLSSPSKYTPTAKCRFRLSAGPSCFFGFLSFFGSAPEIASG